MIEICASKFLLDVCLLTAIPLVSISVVGFVFSLFQSLLQVQDQSSQYLLKLLTLVGVWVYFGRYYEEQFVSLFRDMLSFMMFVK